MFYQEYGSIVDIHFFYIDLKRSEQKFHCRSVMLREPEPTLPLVPGEIGGDVLMVGGFVIGHSWKQAEKNMRRPWCV